MAGENEQQTTEVSPSDDIAAAMEEAFGDTLYDDDLQWATDADEETPSEEPGTAGETPEDDNAGEKQPDQPDEGTEESTEEPAQAPESEEKPERTSRARLKLMEREEQLREREQRFNNELTERTKALEEKEAELAPIRARIEHAEKIAYVDPVGYLMSVVPDLDIKMLAEHAYTEYLGPNAPAEKRFALEASRNRAERERWMQEQKAREEERAAQEQKAGEEAQRAHQATLQSYVTDLERANVPADEFPATQRWLAANPERRQSAMVEAAKRVAAERQAQGIPGGGWPEARAVFQTLENALKPFIATSPSNVSPSNESEGDNATQPEARSLTRSASTGARDTRRDDDKTDEEKWEEALAAFHDPSLAGY